MAKLSRRVFTLGLGALGLGSLLPLGCTASRPPPGAPLPSGGDFLLTNAYLLTMDPELGDIPGGSVLVRQGQILAVGRGLTAPGVPVLDAGGKLVLPGLVDTHWHMWNTLLRSFAGTQKTEGYFPTIAAFGKNMRPGDLYQGTRLAAAEALACGITTVHDYCHNVRSFEHASADLQALRDTGLRARWSFGWPQGLTPEQGLDLEGLGRLHSDWTAHANGGLISLGMAWPGIQRMGGRAPEPLYREELRFARERKLPISVHASSQRGATGQIGEFARQGLLGPDMQIIHALFATEDEIQAMADAGTAVSVSPRSEMRIGYGLPRFLAFLRKGVKLGLSIDTTVLTGNANLFDVMKTARDVENARAESEFEWTGRQLLELGTLGGARSLGLDGRIGSLTPGKRADLIAVSTQQVNMGVAPDPVNLVIEAAQPGNIDTVIVEGRILKHAGVLTALAPEQIVSEASEALAQLRARTQWR
ncbi:amidohydrolase family protein [Stigmatella erecta]|uniref:Cytosine/adenosine deaminase n=1 Tax=Stigmatella erecta TaxID=83460 RepID=A0A1I0DN12_9BACT|nr:amidohydrolase family protein [Stigmatella erecta]SET33732.1 Cytosine/adenosine deaminase [Stigmatella erecta]